ncbi:hypothetical protein QBC46DRAFT_381914 [Diplogelasinospora grovesii]|uniref:Ima1 N-terminal domain-containing protein n=1 Tax=Diplogelasinospora grovesii TaxID=303347 RepID=A0AAN6NAP9_9PEZI|nr:hypothetical protein QBC46DRAFT_381914 [Diplogelasinospora grovesii]
MPGIRRTRYLTCFYCGRKSSTPYNREIRQFDCVYCEATNYLDENGDITDPPVATDKEASPAAKYAVSRSQISPPSSPSSSSTSVFCATCLKNQSLLRATLAQYLPDPDEPDYAEREKNLYKFRRNQEKLYPQICADCEPRVRDRLEQAAYTAKTDLLRRMVDRSACERSNNVNSWSGVFDVFGRWLWIAGLVLQLTWHISIIHALLQGAAQAQASDVGIGADTDATADVNEDAHLQTFVSLLLGVLGPLVRFLPSADRLIRWSVIASVLSAWWNPRYVQISRGFTKHISGVRRWYAYQAMAVVLRALLPRLAGLLASPQHSLLDKQIAGHVFVAGFTILLFVLGPRSIRIDMAPLFGPISSRLVATQPDDERPASRENDENKSMAELLDEIAHSPSRPASQDDSWLDEMEEKKRNNIYKTTQAIMHQNCSSRNGLWGQRSEGLELNSPTLSSPSRPQQASQLSSPFAPKFTSPPGSATSFSSAVVPYDDNEDDGGVDEMDWTPTQSKHRAFSTQGQREGQGFNEAPTEPKRGPFWYRVPPAPTSPAQRLFNPPNQPRLRQSPTTQQQQQIRFRGSGLGGTGGDGRELQLHRQQQDTDDRQYSQVTFAQPRFFPPSPQNDPRDPLSDMFGSSFSLKEQQERRERRDRAAAQAAAAAAAAGGWFGGLFGSSKSSAK